VVLIVAGAAGSFWWFYAQVDAAQTDDEQVTGVVESSGPSDAIGSPSGRDILVLGSDNRTADAEEERRSDTVILVHVDPDADYLSLMSFPRDLRVEIPEHGIDKLNAAYAYGGPALTVQTVEWLTGVDIDEYLEVDFEAFADITDSLGGVYLDIDRRYFNEDPQWELIKLSPGYQLLDGASALDYVRFRHDLNYDFGRMDRQQRFITAMREQTLGWDLPLRLPGIVDALFDNVETTLGAADILKLAYWGVRLDGGRIRQITLTGDPQTRDGVSYVILPEGVMSEAIDKLMTPPAAPGSEEETAATDTSAIPDDDTESTEGDGGSAETTEVVFTTDPGAIENATMWQLTAASAPFVVRAPGYLPEGYAYVDRRPLEGGSYDIELDGDKPGLKVVYQLTREGEAKDQYLGIMETSWLDAPAAGPGQVVERNGIEYTIVGTNQRVDRIWWKVDDTLYWVSNTLSYYLSKKELMNVAESMIVIPSDGAGGRSEGGDGP
jgi:LCP family protein required for cell wall assembly